MIPVTANLIERSNTRARINLHVGQAQAYQSKRRFTFVIAGTQSGKTSFGPLWLSKEIKLRGDGDYLAATSTFDLFKLKMLPEMKYFFCYLQGWKWFAGDKIIASPDNKVRIILRSANSEGGLESSTAKAAWLDECGQDTFRLEAWQAVQRRLSLNQGRVLGTTTPYNLGWLKTEIYDKWRAGDEDYRVIQFASTMNPLFPRAEYDRAEKTLPSWKFRMFYKGEFTRPAGLIYHDFDDEIHIVDGFTIPPEWARWVGYDFGGSNTSSIWLAEHPEKNVFYAYRESLDGGLATKERAREALKHAESENVVFWAGGAKSETQYRLDWWAEGVPLNEPLFAEVETGIDRVIELIKTKRLFVFRSCSGLLDELGTYSRVVDAYGQTTAAIKDKGKFHRLDALRYIVQHITDRGVYFA